MIARLRMVLPVLWKLGVGPVAKVAVYRLARRMGYYRVRLPVQQWESADEFFKPDTVSPPELDRNSRLALLERADSLLRGEVVCFSHERKKVGSPPDWFLDPFTGRRLTADRHWSKIDDFAGGDIKNLWEASRFEWVTVLARAWRINRDERYLNALNNWLSDWVRRNPANAGPNWKCGQETAIRSINLLLAARLLGTHRNPSQAMVRLIALHCERIMPTVLYGVAQNNNHGTSEAAALFIGGAWIMAVPEGAAFRKKAQKWRNRGRCLLEDRVLKLVAEDGSFSQYSTNYHRVLVDTLCQVEVWRRDLDAVRFSSRYENHCCAAVDWLSSMTDADTGNTPNLGANDGARLYDLSTMHYGDFRPTVQLASVLCKGTRAYGKGLWDEPLIWLGLEQHYDVNPANTDSVMHGDGGELIICSGKSRALVRFARFRFRPSHADCLHLDLWNKGQNILRDGGTYSYNTDPRWIDYFSGTEAHNTVQFDGRSQMPRIGRFLFGEWLKMDECTGIQQADTGLSSWTGSYTDGKQARHRRTVSVRGNRWRVIDETGGFSEKAVLRWRLMPGEWKLEGNTCDSAHTRLCILTTAPLRRLELTTGWESLFYQQRTALPVLEVEVGPGQWTIETEITLKD